MLQRSHQVQGPSQDEVEKIALLISSFETCLDIQEAAAEVRTFFTVSLGKVVTD